MIEGHAGGTGIIQKGAVVIRVRSRRHLMHNMRGHDVALHDLAGDLHAGDMHTTIFVGGQVIRLDQRGCHRVRSGDMHRPAAFRAKLARAESDSGKGVELALFRIGEAGIGDVVLDVGTCQAVAASHKPGQHAGRH